MVEYVSLFITQKTGHLQNGVILPYTEERALALITYINGYTDYSNFYNPTV